ncbi:MAG: T9SS type A sorting domain-containing protein, partial [Cloacibacterium sp.]|nr:T9SS type A sorting domain-containing protein [Cloacibacterium sp.]
SVKILPSDNFLSIGNESPKAESIGIYPNPAADWLNMSNNISTNADYTVYNTVGQIMSQGKIMDRKINISRLKKGTYILSITENNVTTANLKFIKK